MVDAEAVADALADFPGLWDALLPRERRRIVELIVGRVVIADDGPPIITARRPRHVPGWTA